MWNLKHCWTTSSFLFTQDNSGRSCNLTPIQMMYVEKQWMIMLDNIQEMFKKSLNTIMQRSIGRSEFCENFSDAFYSICCWQWEHCLGRIRSKEWSVKGKKEERLQWLKEKSRMQEWGITLLRSIWKNRICQKE